MNRQEAAEAAAKVVAERDTIQANLLDLDNSFGKRLLSGAELTGTSRQRWDQAAAKLASLWDVYATYSGVVDRVAALAGGKLGQRELSEVSTLLTGPSVEVNRAPVPLARRNLSDSGRDLLTVSTAVARMREVYTEVIDVVSAAEQCWNSVAAPLDAAAADLARADGLGDEALAAEVAELRGELDRQRATLNSDPLAAQAAAADRLRSRVAAVAAKTAELAQVRSGATERIAVLRAAADSAGAARADALLAWQRTAAKVVTVPPVPSFAADPAVRLALVESLLAAGRWTRLAAELDLLEGELATATSEFHESERTAVALLGRRDELRGLLNAYKAKAGRLGAAEDEALAGQYDQARELLWTAPCDLGAAADAVTSYQRAVLAIGARR